MPTKFRKSVWIKRGKGEGSVNVYDDYFHRYASPICAGDYVIVEPIAEGNKVQAEIVHILYPMQIKSLKQQKLW